MAKVIITIPSVDTDPIQIPHNLLDGLQGGITGQYYHLTQSQYNNLGTIPTIQQVLNAGSKTVSFDGSNSTGEFFEGDVNERTFTLNLSNGLTGNLARSNYFNLSPNSSMLENTYDGFFGGIGVSNGTPYIAHTEGNNSTIVGFAGPADTNTTLLFPSKVNGTYLLATLGDNLSLFTNNGDGTSPFATLADIITPPTITDLPEDFLVITQVGVEIKYYTDSFRTLDISSLVGVTVDNTNEIVRNGNDLFITGNFIDNATNQFILRLIDCKIVNNILTYESSSWADIGMAKVHSFKFHRGFIYYANRADDNAVSQKIGKINPYDFTDIRILSLPVSGNYIGRTSDIMCYKNAVYILMCSASSTASYMIKIDENLTSYETLFNYGGTTGKRVALGSPFMIYNDEFYIPNFSRTTGVFDKAGMGVFSMTGTLKRETSLQTINIAPGTTSFPYPHWMTIFNGKVIFTSVFNRFIARFDCNTLALEESVYFLEDITDDNHVGLDGYIYLGEETIGSNLVKIKYNNFTDKTAVTTVNHASGALERMPFPESLITKLSELKNDSGFITGAEASGIYQPLDSDLTSIAALTTSSYGRSFLTLADASAARTLTGAQAALSGTGFVKISGTTISYDNSTYLTTSSASSTYFPLIGGDITGTVGSGFVGLIPQSSAPSTPASGVRLYARSTGAFSWKGTNGFERSFTGTGLTADRSYTLPDATTTLLGIDNIATVTNKDLSSGTNTFPTFNQDTAGSAAKLTTARTIGIITGDATSTGSSFDGTANNTNSITLATVNSNVGTFGSSTMSPMITVNAKGLITAISNTTIAPAIGNVSGLGSGIATFLATPSSANLITAVTDETGSGSLVFGTTPTITTPNISGAAVFSTNFSITGGATTDLIRGNGSSASTNGIVQGANVGTDVTSGSRATILSTTTFKNAVWQLQNQTSFLSMLNVVAPSSPYSIPVTNNQIFITHNGTIATDTLPTLANGTGVMITIINMGSGIVTLNSNAGGSDIWDGGVSLATTAIAAGSTMILYGNSSKFVIL